MTDTPVEVTEDDYVLCFQTYAESLGFSINPEEDGWFGPETREAYVQICFDNGKFNDSRLPPSQNHPYWLVSKVELFEAETAQVVIPTDPAPSNEPAPNPDGAPVENFIPIEPIVPIDPAPADPAPVDPT
jgi:hypothetical protein